MSSWCNNKTDWQLNAIVRLYTCKMRVETIRTSLMLINQQKKNKTTMKYRQGLNVKNDTENKISI